MFDLLTFVESGSAKEFTKDNDKMTITMADKVSNDFLVCLNIIVLFLKKVISFRKIAICIFFSLLPDNQSYRWRGGHQSLPIQSGELFNKIINIPDLWL